MKSAEVNSLSKRPFSVLISVYKEDNPDHFKTALESIVNQTIVPDEVLVVKDGPLPDDLDSVIAEFQTSYPETFVQVALNENQGLGKALQTGVRLCSHDLIARMDADDVSVSERFEEQLRYLEQHPEVDVLGGYVSEFDQDPGAADRIRAVPQDADEIRKFARSRCPTNHPTVIFRRESVLEAGNYRPWRLMQDYELWMRMLNHGHIIENLPKVLVKSRAGSALYGRRGGKKYARLELKLQREFRRMGVISQTRFVKNVLSRVPIRLVPNRIRELIYRFCFRS
ncbi:MULTISPECIES: glycosyltransferase [Halomicrobium]|uniref:Glycosyl transferase family 2 n=2 Tax=Halomicrobium mukohataei TaxID=57705 RepID=C7P3A2_HALMD|nr:MULTISPECIES: glycosyltransferase [Halomicrobium]ACV47574.1 glycosyl transferase family 2 [Halomicrobium mukohataei DSM 12286]QCD66037.1 glycosyltransferase [Halomicrobium mukohataei]QFR20842.1 glycosyltransferase [Halomicrobium sp. ZPS1]